MFPCGVFFSCIFDMFSCAFDMFLKCLLKCPGSTNPHTPLPALKNFIVLFAECSILNVWQCSEYVCFDNCSVICTVILCYVKQQTHSEFWHVHYSVFSGICQHIKSYSALLRYIHTYWDIFKAYSDLFRHIQHPV